ncbi:MAG: HAD family hydrolase [Sedimentisphaerales bacterium]|nr:HAD family hydrolase [Sedimentisphaerales bacterium]
MITTVVFDLDDTLYDEIDFCRSGFRAAAQLIATLSDRHSPEHVFATLWDCFIAGNHTTTFNIALDRLGVPHDRNVIGRLVEVYRTHTPTLTLPADSLAMLDALKGRYTLALLTDGYLPTQRLKVQALGIEPYFAAIVYTEELGRQFWKPSPRGFERLIEILHASPGQMAYVADNEAKDFIAPNQLGMLTIQLLRHRGLHRQVSDVPLPSAAPRVRTDRIDRLMDILSDRQS